MYECILGTLCVVYTPPGKTDSQKWDAESGAMKIAVHVFGQNVYIKNRWGMKRVCESQRYHKHLEFFCCSWEIQIEYYYIHRVHTCGQLRNDMFSLSDLNKRWTGRRTATCARLWTSLCSLNLSIVLCAWVCLGWARGLCVPRRRYNESQAFDKSVQHNE